MGRWGDGEIKLVLAISHEPLVITDYQLPITNYRFPKLCLDAARSWGRC
ncbi:MAG: hypothetical protein F6J98_29695 [Moorea sp. SIO4G2]|nr:hypothetical protein [Moorena bouillonii]NEO64355.1 hypothetical protein [Moorena sp. SIO4G2]